MNPMKVLSHTAFEDYPRLFDRPCGPTLEALDAADTPPRAFFFFILPHLLEAVAHIRNSYFYFITLHPIVSRTLNPCYYRALHRFEPYLGKNTINQWDEMIESKTGPAAVARISGTYLVIRHLSRCDKLRWVATIFLCFLPRTCCRGGFTVLARFRSLRRRKTRPAGTERGTFMYAEPTRVADLKMLHCWKYRIFPGHLTRNISKMKCRVQECLVIVNAIIVFNIARVMQSKPKLTHIEFLKQLRLGLCQLDETDWNIVRRSQGLHGTHSERSAPFTTVPHEPVLTNEMRKGNTDKAAVKSM
ncbi:Hypothetical protein PHPALM_209 [Phytophthora palmivora]|uniref:PiggyBac transposable element-derived protein domain-containing protein n=1 Tax=Phytophthora palmivora TaxID=4796 RepID=A0A2P4YVE6_9STRA|nr:Hypothetical protein PHPALM_209 [Phytophthora palmivora]